MRKIYITVSESTLYRLAEVAEKERRDPRQQAAYILERALPNDENEQRGIIPRPVENQNRAVLQDMNAVLA